MKESDGEQRHSQQMILKICVLMPIENSNELQGYVPAGHPTGQHTEANLLVRYYRML